MRLRIGPLDLRLDRAWWAMMSEQGTKTWGRFGNLPHIKPGRWGWWYTGIRGVVIEFGSRNSGNKFGCWLKRKGLWPY